MRVRQLSLLAVVCVMAVLMAAWPQAQGGAPAPAQGAPARGPAPAPAQPTITPWVPDAARPIGFMVRNSLDNPSAKLYNTAKQKLLDGQQVFSWTQSRPDATEYCNMAAHYDFVWIEMQHSTMSFADVEKMIGACPRVGVPIIRVPDALEGNIQKATDVGALGIIVPTVNDAIQARDAGRFSKFPPFGKRSSGGAQAGGIWGVGGVNYRQTINDNMLTIVMIETSEGATNANEIASQPGVDVVIVGNADLSSFSGFPASDSRYQDLIVKIHDGVLKAGKFFGCASSAYATGYAVSKDARLFQNGPSKDGFQPPARGAAPGAPAAPAAGAPGAGRQGGAPAAPAGPGAGAGRQGGAPPAR
jgi:2-keto-3-deoxy-L-rhamnonate aldolase RhmA